MKIRITFGLAAIVMAIALAGCQSVRKALDLNTTAVVNFTAEEDINPDPDGRPSPVVIHIFKLADDRQFRRQDFLSLYESPAARLGKDLIGTVVLKEITPGESRNEVIKLTPDVKYLGVMAEVSQYRDADPILILSVLEHNENSFRISISGNHISVPEPADMTERDGSLNRAYKENTRR